MDDGPARFSTGLRFLDQQLDGGVATGGVVALLAPPQSQVELLFREFARGQPLVYVSTLCADESDRRDIVDPADAATVETAYHDPEAILADPEAFASALPTTSYVVVDSVDALERGAPARYLDFLNALKRRMREAGGVAVVHCLKGEHTPENRTLTLKRADHVWDLRLDVDANTIDTTLCITKSRTDRAFSEPLPLEFAERVRIDTSRTIA
jgi:KaiC/GvpD/RAD55 family RecA-like ATPase